MLIAAAHRQQRTRRPRRGWRWVGYIAGALALLVLVGMTYESIARMQDTKAFPPMGRLVSIGDRSLHLYCTGTGSPTVILESGSGAVSPFWLPVQTEVAKTTRVCAYDRAGYGWSDPATKAQTGEQVAADLHALLQAGGEEGPFILVAASLGGMYARTFTDIYPDQVVGMVMVDARHEEVTRRLQELGVKEGFPGGPVERALARTGLFRLLLRSDLLLAESFAVLPAEAAATAKALLLRSDYFPAVGAEFASLNETEERVRAARDLGKRPLVVLTHGHPFADATDEANWQEHQQKLAALSIDGKLVVATESGHEIQTQQPELVVSAIQEVLAKVRKR